MRLYLILVGGLMMVACTQTTPPEAALISDLRTAIATSVDAMLLPAVERPGERTIETQAQILSRRLDAARVTAIRSGAVSATMQMAWYHELLQRRDRKKQSAQPPRLVIFLSENANRLDVRGQLLFDALLKQFEAEAHLENPASELAR